MEPLITLVESSDLCWTALLLILLIGLGSRLVCGQPGLLRAGQITAVAVCLLYAFVAVSRFEPVTSDEWVSVLVRSLTAAGIALGVAWIFLAILTFLYGFLFAPPIRAARDSMRMSRDRHSERRRQREDRRNRRLQELEEARAHPSGSEPSGKPKSKRPFAEKTSGDARTPAPVARWRSSCTPPTSSNGSHARCSTTSSRSTWATTGHRRRSKSAPPNSTRSSGSTWSGSRRQRASPPSRSCARWFQQQKEKIEAMPINDRLKSTYVSGLSERFAELTTKLLEEMEP